jgi:hypothetical protein
MKSTSSSGIVAPFVGRCAPDSNVAHQVAASSFTSVVVERSGSRPVRARRREEFVHEAYDIVVPGESGSHRRSNDDESPVIELIGGIE